MIAVASASPVIARTHPDLEAKLYFEREEGWGNPRSEGDAFTPTPYQNTNRLRSIGN